MQRIGSDIDLTPVVYLQVAVGPVWIAALIRLVRFDQAFAVHALFDSVPKVALLSTGTAMLDVGKKVDLTTVFCTGVAIALVSRTIELTTVEIVAERAGRIRLRRRETIVIHFAGLAHVTASTRPPAIDRGLAFVEHTVATYGRIPTAP